MRILWIVNIVMPDLSDYLRIPRAASGSWLVDILNGLSSNQDIKLAVACVYGKKFRRIEIRNIIYYILPGNGKSMLFYTKKYEKVWEKIYLEFEPNLVHIHGTEYSHGLSFLRAIPNLPSIISIQGILNRIKDVDFGGIACHHFLFGRTLRQWCHFNGEIETHIINKYNAHYEREMFKRVTAINGVSTWDTSIALSFNPKLLVYKLDYNLRESFYKSLKWDLTKVKRYSIFTNPGGVPLKGLHYLIKAAAMLLDKFPDISIVVPGMSGKGGNVFITSAYSHYLNNLINKLDMKEHIKFLGKQTETEMIKNVLDSHITVVPSAIEGTSLILHEAMYLGAPCIASFRGGMSDFISDKHDGFLYDYPEYCYLAARIEELFSNDNLCKQFSQNAIIKAEMIHEREKNINTYKNMYNEIIKYTNKHNI